MALGAHHHTATASAVAFFDTTDAVNDAGGREVGRGNDFHQLVDGGFGVAQHVQASVNHFVQIVRWNVGGHTDRNTARAIHQQVRNAAGQDQRFFFRAVVVGAKVDGFFVDVGQHFVRNFGQTNFGVSHGRSVVAVHRTEVALTVHQHMAH